MSLHPLAILTAVSAGTLLLGIMGAVLAVPLTAVTSRVAASLAKPEDRVERTGTAAANP